MLLPWRKRRPKVQEVVITSKDISEPKGLRDFLEQAVNEFDNMPHVKFMETAESYYKNENDIKDKKRMVIGKDLENKAILKESRVLSNNKLHHNFMKKLTRQKIAYMLGKPFTLTAMKADDDQVKKFLEACEPYLDMRFYQFIKNVGRDSIVKGIGWVQVYYDDAGNLKFRRCEPEEVIPFWNDNDHTELGAVARRYEIEQYNGPEKRIIKHLEFYDPSGVYYYIYDQRGHLVPDPAAPKMPMPNFSIKGVEDKVTEVNWNHIPFIAFKYDADEQSLLKRIKSLIDDYDKQTSEIADAIADNPNSITVIKNYDGASKEEFVQNKNEYRTIFVQGDGDAKTLTTPLNLTDLNVHLERLRQDIYEFGQGVNTADKDIRDTSGVALRFIYADLDMDCTDWGSEVKFSLMQLFWFIQQDILSKTGVDFTGCKYDIVFNTDVIINESETITNCMNSQGIISAKTIAANHPWTLDEQKELEDMRQEEEEQLEIQADYTLGTNNTTQGGSSNGSKSTSSSSENK